jgi:hypothetical protein
MPTVPGFLPSQDAFGFVNNWPAEPAVTVESPLGRLNLGDASNGLCGGMVFAVRDYLRAGRTPPEQQPAGGTPLFRFIVDRLITSWDIPRGVARYYQWMSAGDADTSFDLFGHHVVASRGLAWRTLVEELPRIRADIDAGQPSCLGLVTAHSHNPAELGQNHQVLAYGYEASGSTLRLRIYDPNRGRDDDVWITADTGAPTRATTFRHNLGISHPVRGFFRVDYLPVTPPGTP